MLSEAQQLKASVFFTGYCKLHIGIIRFLLVMFTNILIKATLVKILLLLH